MFFQSTSTPAISNSSKNINNKARGYRLSFCFLYLCMLIVHQGLWKVLYKLFYLRIFVWSDHLKNTVQQRFYWYSKTDFCTKIVVFIVSLNLQMLSIGFNLSFRFAESKRKNQNYPKDFCLVANYTYRLLERDFLHFFAETIFKTNTLFT